MAVRAEIRDAKRVEDEVTIDVTDGHDHWMTFTLEDLQMSALNIDPSHIAGGAPLSGSDALRFMHEAWLAAKQLADEEGLIPL